jgi:hypothetical protein
MDDLPPQIWAALTAVVGTVIGVVTARPRNRADAASALTNSAIGIVNELQEELKIQRGLSKKLAEEIESCELRYKVLIGEMERLRVRLDHLEDD